MAVEGINRQTAKRLVGPGWAALIDELYDRLPEVVTVSQVKEKFGALRIYYWASSLISGPENVEDIVSEIEHRSAEVCERCGRPGRPRAGGWINTLCDECAEKREKGF